MNKGLVPTNSVSKQEVDLMQRTRDILKYTENSGSTNVGPYTANFREIPNGGYNTPRPAAPIMPTYIPEDNRAGVDAMRNIMESLSGVFGGEGTSVLTQEDLVKPSTVLNENTNYRSSSKSGSSWEVTVELDETGSRLYEVKDENRNVYDNIQFSVFEAAYATAKLLNKGKTNMIGDIVELDEDFATYRKDAASTKRNYNKSIKINESAAAEVFAKRYKKSQSSMTAVHDAIKDILKNI